MTGSFQYQYIYGPVSSWRLGTSLGIDPLSQENKICNFNCSYCQIGRSKKYTCEQKVYIPLNKIMEELKAFPLHQIDYLTISGRGEPTLAENLGQIIGALKKSYEIPVAVITNSTLLDRKKVRVEMASADFVIAKLDSCSQQSLQKINDPEESIKFNDILEGIKKFRGQFNGKFALQIMFTNANKKDIDRLIEYAKLIDPFEIQINTPLRHSLERPLSKEEITEIKKTFVSRLLGMKIISVYDERVKKSVESLSDEETLKRRGKT